MSGFPRGGPPGGFGGLNNASLFGQTPMDIFGQGGDQGLANLMGNGGGGQGFPGGGLGEMLGGQFDPSVLQEMSEEDQRAVLVAMQEGNEGGMLNQGGGMNSGGGGGMLNLGGIPGLGGQGSMGFGLGNLGGLNNSIGGRFPGSSEIQSDNEPSGPPPTDAFSREIRAETDKAEACQDPYALAGMDTIFILDTSESMRGEGISQAKGAIERLMSELENVAMESGLEENLCLITCGSETSVVQHLTNDYQLIRRGLERVQPRGSTPLQRALSLVVAALKRAQREVVLRHVLNPRVIILSDGHATNPLNIQAQESSTEETSQQETPGVIEMIKYLITSLCMKFIYIPVGNPDSTFSDSLGEVAMAHIVLAGDIGSLASFHMQQKVTAQVKENQKKGESITKLTVKATGRSQFPSLKDRDVDAVMVLITEPSAPREFVFRYPWPGVTKESIVRSPGFILQGGVDGASLPGGFPEITGTGEGVPQDWPPRDTNTMPFQLPGQMRGPDGLEAQAEEAEEITQEKINELLEKYGGGPPKKDNLPIPLRPGIRVTTGPNWMWRMNGVEEHEQGTVVESRPDEENPTGEFDGWIRVKWDSGVEEDYRFGLDYEFDIEPLKGGMDVVEWPPGKERIILEEEDLSQNDDEDFVETMKRLISRGSSSTQQSSSSTPSGASGFDPRGGPPMRDPGQPPQFLNPKHAEEYARIQREKQQQAAAKTGPQPNTGQAPARPQGQQPSGSVGQQPGGSLGAQRPSPTSETETIYNRNKSPPQQPVKQGLGDQRDPPPQAPHQPQAAPQAGKKTPDDEVCYVWQYYTDQGDWRSYPPDIQKRVESEYLKRKNKGGSIVIDMGNCSERIIFKTMEQRNVEKQVVRPVRRVEADAEKLRELQEMWSA